MPLEIEKIRPLPQKRRLLLGTKESIWFSVDDFSKKKFLFSRKKEAQKRSRSKDSWRTPEKAWGEGACPGHILKIDDRKFKGFSKC